MRTARYFLLSCLLSFFILPALTVHELSAQPIPVDPNVKIGKLQNGLTYYIRKNKEPRNRAELRLVVRAGSLLETDAQQGLAHFMEHMNFNGTTHFPKNKLVDFLQRAGVKFGADLNAYTGFNETVYMLPIPTDSAGLLDNGLQILEDWAHGALLDPDEIEKERGVVLEESRMGRGAQQRMRDQYLKIILNNTRYASRLPIGKDSVIRHFKPETLRAFYKDWYRPDLMAVIAVGDFDENAVERQIQEKFSRIKPVAHPKERKEYEIPLNGANHVAIVTDREYPQHMIQVIYKLPKREEKTLADFRKNLLTQLYNAMMGQRISELTQKADPPFLMGFSNSGSFLGNLDSYNSMALAKDTDQVETALGTLVLENERVRKFGFTLPELERSKKNLLNSIERSYNERDKSQSAQFVSGYVNHFLDKKPVMGIENYFTLAGELIPGITLSEINALSELFFSDSNIAVIIMAPESARDKLPDEQRVLQLLRTAGNNATPYEDQASDQPLLPDLPGGAPVTSRQTDAKTGITDIVLANGVRILIKPTDFKNDQILFKGTSPGGYSLHLSDRLSATLAHYLVTPGGVGPFSNIQLQKYLTGKSVSVRPYIGRLSEGIQGSAAPKDLETALQLTYAYFNAPRKDHEVVKGILVNQKSFLENRRKTVTPEGIFSDTLQALLTAYSPLEKPMTPEDIDEIDLDRAFDIYNDRFSDASDFVFTFVGNLNIDEMLPLLQKYLGGLKSTGRKESFRFPKTGPVQGRVEKILYKGMEPKSMVSLNFSGDYIHTPEATMQMDALDEVLQIKLIEALREEESGVYSVSVNMSYGKLPYSQYVLSIRFGCAPENVDRLINRTLTEIDKIKKEGATTGDISKFVAESRRKLETAMQTNPFWLQYIDDAVFEEEDLHQLYQAEALWQTVTPASTRDAARTYLNENNFIRLVLLPEE